MRTALLVGGPKDGEVIAVEDSNHFVRYAEPVDPLPYDHPIDGPRTIDTRTRTYVEQRVRLFGLFISVWVWDGIIHDEYLMARAVARHLLSPMAHRLAYERNGGP